MYIFQIPKYANELLDVLCESTNWHNYIVFLSISTFSQAYII